MLHCRKKSKNITTPFIPPEGDEQSLDFANIEAIPIKINQLSRFQRGLKKPDRGDRALGLPKTFPVDEHYRLRAMTALWALI